MNVARKLAYNKNCGTLNLAATRRSRGVGLVASEDEDVIGLERVKRGEVRDLGKWESQILEHQQTAGL